MMTDGSFLLLSMLASRINLSAVSPKSLKVLCKMGWGSAFSASQAKTKVVSRLSILASSTKPLSRLLSLFLKAAKPQK
jgi:hypothetical protein